MRLGMAAQIGNGSSSPSFRLRLANISEPSERNPGIIPPELDHRESSGSNSDGGRLHGLGFVPRRVDGSLQVHVPNDNNLGQNASSGQVVIANIEASNPSSNNASNNAQPNI